MKLSVRTKLKLLVALALLGVVATAWIGRREVQLLAATGERLVANGARIATHMEGDMMHDALRADVMAALLANGEAEHQQAAQDVKEHAQQFRESLARNEEAGRGAPSAQAINALRPVLDQYINEAENLVRRAAKDRDGARADLPEFLRVFSALEERMEDVTKLLQTEGEVERSDAVAGATRSLSLGVGLAAVFLTVASMLITRSIVQRLQQAIDILVAVARRDFSQRLKVEDDEDEVGRMGQSLNQALDAIDNAFSELDHVGALIAETAGTVAAAASRLSEDAKNQASRLEETSASVEQITATVKQTAGVVNQASELSNGSLSAAESGGRVASHAKESMDQVAESSRKIAQIIGTIDEIALQTNLLSLNAAVEAARAGVHGAGFSVVAAEVGSLATRCAGAAKEVKTLIHDAIMRVDDGHSRVVEFGGELSTIIGSVKQTTALFREIAVSAREQSQGIDLVNNAIASMDQVTREQSEQTTELSKTSEELYLLASRLHALLAEFKLVERGSAAQSGVVRRPEQAQTEQLRHVA